MIPILSEDTSSKDTREIDKSEGNTNANYDFIMPLKQNGHLNNEKTAQQTFNNVNTSLLDLNDSGDNNNLLMLSDEENEISLNTETPNAFLNGMYF